MSDAKSTVKIAASRFKEASQVRNVWAIVPEDGTVFEDVLDPAYWAHISSRLRPGDLIEITAEDGSYFATLFVRSAGRLWAQVAVLSKITLSDSAKITEAPLEYELQWKGPHRKHAVVRIKDKSIIKDGFDTKDAASRWLGEHQRALAA